MGQLQDIGGLAHALVDLVLASRASFMPNAMLS